MKLGLVVALEKEALKLVEELGQKIEETIDFGFAISKYKVKNNEIVLLTGAFAEIQAALATELLIIKYNADLILNFGLAGALKPDFAFGEVLAVKDVVHYEIFDIDAGRRGIYSPEKSAEMPVSRGIYDRYVADLRQVRIASGDKFVDNTDFKNGLVEEFDADIADMEAAGIQMAAKRGGVPLLMIKAVSDSADENALCDFRQAIKGGVESYVGIIKKIIEA